MNVCKNCGDKYVSSGANMGGRAHLGWCVGCYKAWRYNPDAYDDEATQKHHTNEDLKEQEKQWTSRN